MVQQNQEEPVINSLEDALKIHNQNQQAAAQADLGSENGDSEPGSMGEETQLQDAGGQQVSTDEGYQQPASSGTHQSTDTGSMGGSSAGIGDTSEGSSGTSQQVTPTSQDFDTKAIKTNFLKQIQQQAIKEITDEFKEKGIQKYNIGMLYQRDENTGTVTFVNPDDERRPFQSRHEAQQWVDSINQEIDNEYRRLAMERQSKLIGDNQARLAFIDFIPTYNTLSDGEKAVFEHLVQPYAIEQNGQVLGFNCDLNVAYQQAKAISASFKPQTTQTQQTQQVNTQNQSKPAQPGTTPALDANTNSAGQDPSADQAPRNLNDALKKVNAANRAKKGR